jgi:hypothetical protein
MSGSVLCNRYIFYFLCALLSACGGGGGGGANVPPTDPNATFNVDTALKNYFTVSYSKNVTITTVNLNNLSGTGVLTKAVTPNVTTQWYNYQPGNCTDVTAALTKVVDSLSVRYNTGQTDSSTATNYFSASGRPYIYDSLTVYSYTQPPSATRVGAESHYLSATDAPNYEVKYLPGVPCISTRRYLRSAEVKWSLRPDTAGNAMLVVSESSYDRGTFIADTYLLINPAGSILSRKYESYELGSNGKILVE